MLEVSRDTLREAIASLAEAGWVVARRGRYGGTFVSDELPTAAPISAGADRDPMGPAARLEDTLALRAVIEVGVARRAAESELAAGDRERLWQAYEECRSAPGVQYRMARLPPAPAHRRGDRGAERSSRSWPTCACA